MHWRHTYLAFARLPPVQPYLRAGLEAWIFSPNSDRVYWCNRTAARRLRASRFERLAAQRFGPATPLRRSMATLLPNLGHDEVLARIRLPGSFSGANLACRCHRVFAAGGESGLLVIVNAPPAPDDTLADLVGFLQAADNGAEIRAPDGTVLAGGSPHGHGRPVPGTNGHGGETDHPGRGSTSAPIGLPDGSQGLLVLGDIASRQAADPPGDTQPTAAQKANTDPHQLASPSSTGFADRTPDQAPGADPAQDLAQESAKDGEQNDPSATPPEPQIPEPQIPEAPAGPVRFLWQTDSEHRVLFISPGLARAVGRGCEIEGEIWSDAAKRLGLDPGGRIADAFERRDTWSGLTAWWPAEQGGVWYPAEMTALPIFGIDQSFQGFRGFGVLKPADALIEREYRARFGSPFQPAEDGGGIENKQSPSGPLGRTNIVHLPGTEAANARALGLAGHELNAFEEIAAALNERVERRIQEETDKIPSPVDHQPEGRSGAVRPESALNAPPLAHDADPAGAPQSQRSMELESAGQDQSQSDPLPTQTTEPATATAEPSAENRIAELTSILNTATDGVLIMDDQGTVEDLNSSAQALFGVEKTEICGSPFVKLFAEKSRQTALDYLSGLRESGVASVLNEGREVEGLAGEGTIPLFMTMGRVGSAEPARFCAVLRDITQWKRVESDLVSARLKAEQDSSQKSDFLARVSHEIRTPLNAIIGFAELMIEERFGPVENERYRDYLRDIRTSAEHVVSLVNDLLDISKIESGKLDLEFVAVSLNDLIRDCITLMQPQANRAQVVLRVSLSPDVPAIVADQRTVRQIILNLLSNSIKFTNPGGQVIASTSLADDGDVLLRVRDTGDGMSEDDLIRALEPFRQLATAKIGGNAGTGLGLPLTKALTEANRATFAIQSAKGEGTIVKVTFPSTRVLSE